MTNLIHTIEPETLTQLGPKAAVILFRGLLWAQARVQGIPLTKIDISLDVDVPDGGIDASIHEDAAGAENGSLSGNMHFQIKSGTSASPWQKSWAKKEPFGSTTASPASELLGDSVRRCCEGRGTYVLVCFGTDLTSSQQKSAESLFDGLFCDSGFRYHNWQDVPPMWIRRPPDPNGPGLTYADELEGFRDDIVNNSVFPPLWN